MPSLTHVVVCLVFHPSSTLVVNRSALSHTQPDCPARHGHCTPVSMADHPQITHITSADVKALMIAAAWSSWPLANCPLAWISLRFGKDIAVYGLTQVTFVRFSYPLST